MVDVRETPTPVPQMGLRVSSTNINTAISYVATIFERMSSALKNREDRQNRLAAIQSRQGLGRLNLLYYLAYPDFRYVSNFELESR